jgi:Tol biopolymer transport system component
MRHRNAALALFLPPVVVSALALPAAAQYTQRVSVTSSGAQGTLYSSAPAISSDGRFVAFQSRAPLVPHDGNNMTDVFVRDRTAGTTTLASTDSAGAQGDSDSVTPSISADGRYVAFASFASNLVPGDTNLDWDVFVKDRETGQTVRASVDSSGVEGNGASAGPAISADGRFVAFWSRATNLVPNDTNGAVDVFVRDLAAGTTTRVSVDVAGAEADADSGVCSISGDGRFVAFQSLAALDPSDANGDWDVYVRDRLAGTTARASLSFVGNDPSGDCEAPSISADGRFVAFQSDAPDLVASDPNGKLDVFVRDLAFGTTALASVSSTGAAGDDISFAPSLSADGSSVAFVSLASTLVAGDTNGPLHPDAFRRDLDAGTTERVNLGPSNLQDDGGVDSCAISGDGRNVAFDSTGDDLVPNDTNATADVFVRDLFRGTGFSIACDAGVAGIVACPCANPPSDANRGCDNSSATGGAILAATGGAFLSEDTLAFTTSDERPTAASFLMEGTSDLAGGAPYGQGVRCLTGELHRLYHQTAIAGSITVPDVAAGDPPVSVRAATLGRAIAAGESRWYLVAYRDPIVLGGCPASRTFNTTPTGRVVWAP